MLYHMPPLTRRNPRRNDTPHRLFYLCNPPLEKTGLFPTISFGEVNLSLVNIILYLGKLGPPLGKIGLAGGTCPSLTFSFEEVTLSIIFSLGGKNLPFGPVILSSGINLLLLRGTTLSLNPPLGNLPSTLSLGKISLYAFFLGIVTFPIALSFRGVNLPLKEKALYVTPPTPRLGR